MAVEVKAKWDADFFRLLVIKICKRMKVIKNKNLVTLKYTLSQLPSSQHRSLSQGLDTILNSDSSGLSAGQAQLLAFARVFLKNPGLVILDEASSRLDPTTEMSIERAIDRLLKDRTAIVIAHRLKTIQRADQILILDRGKIVEYGDRATLAQNPHSRFYNLLKLNSNNP